MHVENMSDPAGDTHTFEPRPRPATCTVAEAVKPVGSLCKSWTFLTRRLAVRSYYCLWVDLLLKHRVRARDDFPIQHVVSEPSGFL